MIFDSDIVVVLINIMALALYLKGENTINEILSHNFWSVFNRFYFSFILFINAIIMYNFYVSETKIVFNLSNCFLHSFICGILTFSISIIVYITFELPFKKSIRFLFKLKE